MKLSKKGFRDWGILFALTTIFGCFWAYLGIMDGGNTWMLTPALIAILFGLSATAACLGAWRKLLGREQSINFGVEVIPAGRWRRISRPKAPADEARPHIVPLNKKARVFLLDPRFPFSEYVLGEILVRGRWRVALRFSASDDLADLERYMLPQVEAAYAEFRA